MNLDFFLNNKVGGEPDNWKETEIQLDFTNDFPSASVTTNAFEFLGEQAKAINDYVAKGLSGGAGITEGFPFRIDACQQTILDGCLNLGDESTEFECDKVKTIVRETGKIDFLNDRAAGVTFALLASLNATEKGYIGTADYLQIPYVQSNLPNYESILMCGISSFMLGKELLQATEKVLDLIAIAVESAGIALAIAIAELVFWIAYIIAIIYAMGLLLTYMLNNLLQVEPKFKKGMLVRTMLIRASEYLGFNFSSSILNSASSPFYNLTILPAKRMTVPRKTGGLPFLDALGFGGLDHTETPMDDTTGFYEGNFGELLSSLSDVFNAKVHIIGNTIHFERFDNFNNNSTYQIPVLRSDNLNITAPDPHRTNFSELASNYLVTYALDGQDLNTYDEYEGTNCQMIMKTSNVSNQKNSLLKGITEKRLEFALAKRKEEMSFLDQVGDQIYQDFGTAINAVIFLMSTILFGVVGGTAAILLTNSPPALNLARIGRLKLTSDYTGVPKLFIFDTNTGLINQNNKGLTSAAYLMAKYHSASFAVKSGSINFHNRKTTTSATVIDNFTFANKGNQYLIYKDKSVPLCCEDYNKLKNNNVCKTEDGKDAKIDSLKWNPFEEKAIVDYRVKQDYVNNLTLNFIVDGAV